MGLFDRFKAVARSDKKERSKANPAAKWADRVERRAQNYDRQEAIQALAELGTAEAVEILVRRFTFHIDPSITDQEEKDAAFRGILRAGDQAIEPVRAFAAKAESLAWPMNIMKELLDEERYIEELVRWLSLWDTEYAKFVDPKVQILAELEGFSGIPKIRTEVERFLEDVNEPARFHAVCALLAQDDPTAALPLAMAADRCSGRERARTKQGIVEGLAGRAWTLPEEEREAVRKAQPATLTVDRAGKIAKR